MLLQKYVRKPWQKFEILRICTFFDPVDTYYFFLKKMLGPYGFEFETPVLEFTYLSEQYISDFKGNKFSELIQESEACQVNHVEELTMQKSLKHLLRNERKREATILFLILARKFEMKARSSVRKPFFLRRALLLLSSHTLSLLRIPFRP